MPNSSDSCARVCEILLLLELLRRQRPDLNFERAESLLSLVGGFDRSKLLAPSKSRAGRLIREGLLLGHLPHAKARPRTPLDALIVGLEVAPQDLPPETVATRIKEDGQARSARESFLEMHVPLGLPIILPKPARDRLNALVKPLKALARDDRAQNLACGIALPFAFKAVSSGNAFLIAVGAVTLLGCGVELGVDDPQFLGPGLPFLDLAKDILPGGGRGR